jgi:hypothetical protein
MHGITAQQSMSLPSSPVTHPSAESSPLTSPLQPSTAPPNTTGITLQVVLSPQPVSAHPRPSSYPNTNTSTDPNSTSHTNPGPSHDPIPDPTAAIPDLSVPNLHSTKSTPIQIPHLSPSNSSNPISTSPHNPLSISPINPVSISPIGHDPIGHDLTDDTLSEISQHDTGSVVEGDGEDWDVDWLLEDDGEERKDDDSVLYTEIEGRIDLQGGLSQFVQFLSAAKHDFTGRYMDRLLREDIGPCLRLRMHEDRAYRKLLEAVWHNRIFVEHLAVAVPDVCAGCGAENTCQWRVRIGSSRDFKNMGDQCRERIVRTCDFYMYLRNLRQGLVKKTLPNIYKEFLRLRLMMNFARLCAG